MEEDQGSLVNEKHRTLMPMILSTNQGGLPLICDKCGPIRDGNDDDESEAHELDYAEQTQLIAQKAKLALVNRQIDELKRVKKTISTNYASADAQLALAEVRKDGCKT